MFIHLRTHSDYSLLTSTVKTEQLIKLAAENKMPAIALTDNNNLSGSLEFSEYAITNGIQPIIGCNLNLKYEDNEISILLLVKNETGYKNLLNILYKSSIKTQSLTDLKNKTKGLLALTGEIFSEKLIKSNLLIEELISLFPDNLYIELQRLGNNETLEERLIKIAHKYNLPLVATNKVLFATKNDYEAHEALTCIKKGIYISDENIGKTTAEHYLKSQQEMSSLFADIPEAIVNTVNIAKRCSFIVEGCNPTLPDFPCEIDENEEIKKQAYSGLKVRLSNQIPEHYRKRMDYELGVIINMEYSGYFLIVSDFIKWSKNHDIPVGPGRGSGVGSIVAWALQITDLDPMKFNLIFERFLNPERISMPDFDIDFCQKKRDLVIKYIQQKYGYVAQIITFGNLQPRAVIRDVGRVLQIPYFQVDQICKMIPHNPVKPVTLLEAIELDTELQKARNNDETIDKLLTIGLKLEGLHRHSSTHAAGIVISSKPLTEAIPVSHDKESELPITQYSMKYVEKAGLVKFDFLGLKTLTVIHDTCKLAHNLNINNIKLNDNNTFELLSNGDSVGIFQLENAFMRQTLKKLKPDSLEDIIALISLNRPGPMENITTYISRKHGTEAIEYIHPKLEEVLKETFGVIIYQEQVMEIAQIIAGYTAGAADILRRAMGKKIKSEMDLQQDIFIKGAIENGISKSKASYIFNLVAKFAGYGFNKSHAAAYALISYQTAYLKANYLPEFLTASMNLDIDDTDKLQLFCNEAKQHKIKVLPPDINKSKPFFTVENGSIRYGLAALKSVGKSAAEELCKRQYHNINDLIYHSELNKRAIESLAKSGAFDSIHNKRRQIYESSELISRSTNKNNQASLFGSNSIKLMPIEEWDSENKLNKEYEAIGFFLSKHPINKYKKVLSLIESDNVITGIVTKVKMRSSKRGRFCMIVLSHPDEIYDIAFYDHDTIEQKRNLFTIGKVVAISIVKGENGIRGTTINTLENFISSKLSKITLYIHDHDIIPKLSNLFTEKGNTNVTLRVKSGNTEIDIGLPQAYKFDFSKIMETDKIEIVE
ncbi:MAG: DNA polymerase III subunit alpha [Rickettsiaceae bacterium H1]|nr:DNA polymerase III subunit alpha [Rickettsiaceae bacterium H1]